MNVDIYSDRAKQAIQSAQSLALARRHQQLSPEHLLKVLMEERDGLSDSLVKSAGGRPQELEAAVEQALTRKPKVEGGSGQLYMTPETARVFAMNLRVLTDRGEVEARPSLADALDAIVAGRRSADPVRWHVRQLAWERTG